MLTTSPAADLRARKHGQDLPGPVCSRPGPEERRHVRLHRPGARHEPGVCSGALALSEPHIAVALTCAEAIWLNCACTAVCCTYDASLAACADQQPRC